LGCLLLTVLLVSTFDPRCLLNVKQQIAWFRFCMMGGSHSTVDHFFFTSCYLFFCVYPSIS
jgi:hypothetical protein